jgi:hypothetical protein
MLLGLALLAIPPIIHLLNRRRFDVVDWGAMQFLQVSEVTRRRLMLEEVLLMMLRMGLLGVLVFALAGPFLDVDLPAAFATRPTRDVVLVLDGSASMAATDEAGGASPDEKAREWVAAFLDELGPQDGVSVLVARDQVIPVVETLSSDRERVRSGLEKITAPTGSANWPEAIKQAFAVLDKSQRARREVILLGDNQKFGWADPDTQFRWELLAHELALDRPADRRPRVWCVNLAKDRAAAPPNYGLAPLTSNRPVVPVDREVTFRGELILTGQTRYAPPNKIRLEVDGKPVRDLPPPGGKAGNLPLPKDGRVPFSFAHRFTKPGSHLVSVILEPDPPPEDRPPGYAVKDRVPGDNRQDYALEVLSALPVVVIDGGSPSSTSGSDFIRDALSPARDRNPSVKVQVVPADDFQPALLTSDARPRVVILHDVARLRPAQAEAVASFAATGGGVLVALGGRADQAWYNEQLYRSGEGWLPARLDGIAGDEANSRDAARPDPESFKHPVLELFEKAAVGGLGDARFPRWWKLVTAGRHSAGVPVGQLQGPTAKHPFLVERAFQAGRVLVCAVPLDASWGSNVVDLPAFVPLVHEAVYYLAGARSAEFNLKPGQPIRWRTSDGAVEDFRLAPPGGEERPLSSPPGEPGTYVAQMARQEHGSQLVYEGTREPGVYRLLAPQEQTVYYVVPTDPRESDLTACTTEERDGVGRRLGLTYEDDRDSILGAAEASTQRQELWAYLLLGLIGLLCLEVWMTRRLVMSR